VDHGLAAELSNRGPDLHQVHAAEVAEREAGILYENDDFGKDYPAGVKDVPGAKYDKMVIRRPART